MTNFAFVQKYEIRIFHFIDTLKPRINSPATSQKVAILAGLMFASQGDKYILLVVKSTDLQCLF